MRSFLRRFADVVVGVLTGFDRVVFKGRLPQLYSPEGMNCYAAANHVSRLGFKKHAKEVTQHVLEASLVESAKAAGRFHYLGSGRVSKDEAARAIRERHPIDQGLAALLQCVEPCWTFDTQSIDRRLTIVGAAGKCSALYHYYVHPRFGWMYVRLQTWFPFEVQIGLNGREWLAHQMDRAGLTYVRSDNKFLWVEEWRRAQQFLQAQLRTNWVKEFDALVREVHPLHPHHLGRLPLAYNWTVHQSEWATDVAFSSRAVLEEWYKRWVRHGFLNFASLDVLRFLGRSRLDPKGLADIHSDVRPFDESVRLKHSVNGNSLKMYDHQTVLRGETTINNPKEFRSYRAAVGDPEGDKDWRALEAGGREAERQRTLSGDAGERGGDLDAGRVGDPVVPAGERTRLGRPPVTGSESLFGRRPGAVDSRQRPEVAPERVAQPRPGGGPLWRGTRRPTRVPTAVGAGQPPAATPPRPRDHQEGAEDLPIPGVHPSPRPPPGPPGRAHRKHSRIHGKSSIKYPSRKTKK